MVSAGAGHHRHLDDTPGTTSKSKHIGSYKVMILLSLFMYMGSNSDMMIYLLGVGRLSVLWIIRVCYRKALGHIPPLSLCPVSCDRPKFLTKHVLQEVEKFVTDIALWVHFIMCLGFLKGEGGGVFRQFVSKLHLLLCLVSIKEVIYNEKNSY